MQWTSGRNAGFSDAATTWLPVPLAAATRNVVTMAKDPSSILNFYKQAIRLRRRSPALLEGNYTAMSDDPNVFAYRRQHARQTMIVALNMSGEPQTLRLSANELSGAVQLRVAISNIRAPGLTIDAARVELAPYEALALEVLSQ